MPDRVSPKNDTPTEPSIGSCGLASALASSLILVSCFICSGPLCDAQKPKKAFTVADDIGITVFWPVGFKQKMVEFSPDGNYFAAYTERGRLDVNRVEDSLRIYRSEDVKEFFDHPDLSPLPSPVWNVSCSDEHGPVINDWRWLPDSSGMVFLEGPADGDKRLVLADLRKKKTEQLTSATETVTDFDIRDRKHYVYIGSSRSDQQKLKMGPQAAIVGTGQRLSEFLFPDRVRPRNYLLAVVNGKPFEVKSNGAPFVPVWGGRSDLALSPDGQSVVTQVVVPEVPVAWETLYPSPDAAYPWTIRAGHQDQQSGTDSVRQYVLIHLQTGSVRALTDAPESALSGWETAASPSWSSDGQAVLLPGTFIRSKHQEPSRPCIAVVEIGSGTSSCVETLSGIIRMTAESGSHFVTSTRFINGDRHGIVVDFSTLPNHALGATEYRRVSDGEWQVVGRSGRGSEIRRNGLEITVEEAFDRPPLLVAKEKGTSRVIWDPNPQLKNIDLGQASVYRWKDNEGRQRVGGLYKPSDYKPERHYPLVIQTHGFFESYFHASGLYPPANAAREMAAVGIVVLQVAEDDCVTLKPDEGPCAVGAYEAAARKLVSEGLVDPERIGIVGFSRTCYYVMETLTSESLRIRAASVTSGLMMTYLQYMLLGGGREDLGGIGHQFNAVIGASPFGEGLQQWLKRSPGFNLDKVDAPLLIVAEGSSSLLFSMWEPYAGLHYLNRPVDLIILNTREHVVTNPAVRMAAQSETVDWFRFWLKDEEDPDPAKKEQYIRWRDLRKLQLEHENEIASHRATSN